MMACMFTVQGQNIHSNPCSYHACPAVCSCLHFNALLCTMVAQVMAPTPLMECFMFQCLHSTGGPEDPLV